MLQRLGVIPSYSRLSVSNDNLYSEALLRSLEENEVGAFLEILDTYLGANRIKIERETNISRTTVNMLSQKEEIP